MTNTQRYYVARTVAQHIDVNHTHVVEVLDDWDNPEGYQVSVEDGKEYAAWITIKGQCQTSKHDSTPTSDWLRGLIDDRLRESAQHIIEHLQGIIDGEQQRTHRGGTA